MIRGGVVDMDSIIGLGPMSADHIQALLPFVPNACFDGARFLALARGDREKMAAVLTDVRCRAQLDQLAEVFDHNPEAVRGYMARLRAESEARATKRPGAEPYDVWDFQKSLVGAWLVHFSRNAELLQALLVGLDVPTTVEVARGLLKKKAGADVPRVLHVLRCASGYEE
jgi:hypothetical protein